MKILGIGVDITEVSRLRKVIEKWGELFLKKVFTDNEILKAKTHNSFYQHLAGRFAAKEAVFKACGDLKLGWKEIEIFNDQNGKPYCKILNGKAKNLQVIVSISHVKSYAVANAVITKKS